jgi:hypothetical protein
MPFQGNRSAFANLNQQNCLIDSYRMLVALELALKDLGITPSGGHDIPMMLVPLSVTGSPSPIVAGQLNTHISQLRHDLNSIVCQGRNGTPQSVPSHSYPYIRYARLAGDWSGHSETPLSTVQKLEATCRGLISFLRTNYPTVGI